MENPCPVAVLISGNGSNLQALIDASKDSNYRIVGVISNNPQAFGLQRAEQADIPTSIIDHRTYPDRISFDRELMAQLDELKPALIVLAGFMRILSSEFVNHFAGRIINIHPSLLPKYPGTNTHQRVLDAGDDQHGVSIHFVTEHLDGGPVVAHASVPVDSEDDVDSLQQKIHFEEHRIYPQVVSMFAAGRLTMRQEAAWLDDTALPTNGLKL
ncbi:MAG: phosphoribosylglycinamide formyltransferase [Gammaproteobacteria bacterium]|nr:phosphoribosylglycinamide formyltransferase [Gammaproteobacteria bacterium]